MITSKKHLKSFVYLLIILIGANVLATLYFQRFDLTKHQRYTLSNPTKKIVQQIDQPLLVRVFLKGEFPSNFRRLQNETRYLLEEFRAYNPSLKFIFINPLIKNEAPAEAVGRKFFQAGMPPKRLNVKKNGKNSQSLLFPWAIATLNGKSVKIPLLSMTPGDSNEELVNKSVQNLEYAFADAFKRLTSEKRKKIAILRGNGELPTPHLASFLQTVGAYYHTAPFTLDSVAKSPQKTLHKLENFDLVVVAKPTIPFTEKEKYVLDQYAMNGGKTMWFVDVVAAERDSLFSNPKHQMMAYPRDLKLTNFFFKYGVRMMPSLVNDLHADNIILASGDGKQTQFTPFPWYYAPLSEPQSDHPIVHNIQPVRFDFASPMELLKNDIKKTVLLQSSIATRIVGTPRIINLDIIHQQPNFEAYRDGAQNLAVLLEGEFTSVFKNRVKPFKINDFKPKSSPTKMVVVSDGDVIKNNLQDGQPTSLAYDPHTGMSYGNQDFLLNTVNYMLDDSGLLNIRTQKVSIAFLDSKKVAANRLFWQVINIGLPLIILIVFGIGFKIYRRRKYRH